ncbi:M56 family metallopeptidase [Oxalobacteraceae bacterium A2-2]
MSSELLRALAEASITGGIAAALVLALRQHLRRLFGMELAYLAWSAVPLALLAALLPAMHSAPLQLPVLPARRLLAYGAPLLPATPSHGQEWLAAAWLAGCIAMLAWLWRGHARYRARLGPLRDEDGLLHSASAAVGPAVVGLWRPAIVLPADFGNRYTAREQQLILAHERVHLARRDPLQNGLCALILCLFWFHPLLYLAARRYRLDQELACDAAVMRAHPGLRRSYAEAMLKTQLSAWPHLIHCQWQSIHPLKERIMQLQQQAPRPLRRLAGRAVIATLVGACTLGAVAAHAGAGKEGSRYQVAIQLEADGETATPRLLVRENEPFAVASGAWRGEFLLKKVNEQSVYLKSTLKQDGAVVGQPALLVTLGQQAGMAVNGLKLQLTITPSA